MEKDQLIMELTLKALDIARQSPNEIERSCWMVVHEHRHGVMPVEYDIRDIDEDLYLLVLRNARREA